MSPSYLKEKNNFFRGKIFLDARCNSNASSTYSIRKYEAEKVYAFDLDEIIFDKEHKINNLQN